MAENRVSITINARNEAGPAINQAKKDVEDLGTTAGKTGATVGKTSRDIDGFGKSATGAGSAAGKAGRVVDGFGRSAGSASQATRTLDGSLSSTMSTALRFAGIIASGLIFNSAIQSAYSYNRTLEDTQLGLASLAYATMEFSDAQGKVLTGQAAFNESLQFSSQFQDKLRIAGLQTAATFEQLSNAVTQAWTPAVQAGFNPDQIVSFTSATTQAATAMGINLNQMGEEIRSVLSGTMTSMNTRLMPLMNSVGLTNEKLKELARTGELYPAVMKAFEGATLAAEKANVSLGVSFSNLQDATQSILGIGLKPFFDELGVSARDLTSHIFTVKDGTIVWNKSLMELASSIGSAMGQAVKWTYEHTSSVIKWNDEHRELLKITGLVIATLGSVLLAFKALSFISTVTALINKFTASVTLAQFSVQSLTSWIGLAGAAFAGWQIGTATRSMELFGHTVDTWTQSLYASVDLLLSDLGFKLADTFWYKPKEYFGKFIGEFVTWNERLKQSIESIPLVGEAAGKALEAIGWDKQAEALKKYGQEVEDNARKSRYAHQESVEQDQQRINMTKQAILDEEKRGTTVETASTKAINAKIKEIEGEQKKASEIKKLQNEQNKLHEKMWKAQTATVEDQTEKQLEIAKHQYEQNVKAAKGNSQLLLEAERTYQAQLASIRQKEKEENEKKLQAIADKHREYRQIVEKNEAQSLDNRLAANQKWYQDELRELDAWAEKHKVTGRELEVLHNELAQARAIKEGEIIKEAAEKEQKALQEKVKAWDKAYENIADTLTGFLENGKLDLDSFTKTFKNFAANLVSTWIVNMARMSLPAWIGGTAGLSPVSAFAGSSSGYGYTDRWMPASSSGESGLFSTFGNLLSGGWATKLGGYLSENGATSVGGWLSEAGSTGFLSGATGAGLTAGMGTAIIQGLMTGNWKQSLVSGVGTGLGAAIGTAVLPGIGTALGAGIGGYLANNATSNAVKYAAYGSVLPGIGTTIGYIAGSLVGDKYDDADLHMSIGDSNRTISEYDTYIGTPTKALYTSVSGDWIPSAGTNNSAEIDDAFMLDIRQGDARVDKNEIVKLEQGISKYFKTTFDSIDKAFGLSVRDIISNSRVGLAIHISNLEQYLKSGDITGALNKMTGEFFGTYGKIISSAIFNMDTGDLFNQDALETLKRDSETLGDTFIRVAGLLQAIPDGISRIRTLMEDGLTEAEAFGKLEGQYAFVSGVLGNALSEAMQQGVKAADFEAFKETFTTSLENQLKAAVAASFQQQILTKIITDSFGSMADYGDMLEKVRKGEITVEEFKSYLRSGVEAAKASLKESEPLMKAYWDIINLTPSKADAALEQAKAYATDVVSGTITSALQMGVDAADWNVFKENIQSQLNAQLQTIVLNSIASSMINSVLTSVLPDGGGLEKLNKDFSDGIITADEYGSRIQALGTKITDAISLWEPVFGNILTAFNIKPKDTNATDAAADLASQPDTINDAIETFNKNKADASLMLAFIDGLVEKIPDLVTNYALLDAALITHQEGLLEYGDAMGELSGAIAGYVAEVRDLVNSLASAAGEAAEKASEAASAAAEAARSAADSAKSASDQSGLLLAINRNTSKTVDVLDRMAPDGDALQVRVTE